MTTRISPEKREKLLKAWCSDNIDPYRYWRDRTDYLSKDHLSTKDAINGLEAAIRTLKYIQDNNLLPQLR